MNELYFACATCRNYIDAGYRHCYWTLKHPGFVERGKPVNLEAVWNANEYWHGAKEVRWLEELLPKVRAFLLQHQEHDLIFGDAEDFGAVPMYNGDYRLFDWLNEEGGTTFDLLPRFLAERLSFDSWTQVQDYVQWKMMQPPWWWYDPEYKAKAKAKFIQLVRSKAET